MDGRKPVRSAATVLARSPGLLAVLLALASLGCVSGNWVRESADKPISMAHLSEIEVHASTLQQVLDLFGAPLSVWESEYTSVGIAYGWYESRAYNVKVLYTITGGGAANFDLDRGDAQMNGVVFFFDKGWTLRAWRAGRLQDILGASARVRPTLPPPG